MNGNYTARRTALILRNGWKNGWSETLYKRQRPFLIMCRSTQLQSDTQWRQRWLRGFGDNSGLPVVPLRQNFSCTSSLSCKCQKKSPMGFITILNTCNHVPLRSPPQLQSPPCWICLRHSEKFKVLLHSITSKIIFKLFAQINRYWNTSSH